MLSGKSFSPAVEQPKHDPTYMTSYQNQRTAAWMRSTQNSPAAGKKKPFILYYKLRADYILIKNNNRKLIQSAAQLAIINIGSVFLCRYQAIGK